MMQAEIPRLLTIDEKLKVSIAPECKAEALKIASTIKKLREKVTKDQAILEQGQEISKRYNVAIEELHQLSLSIPYIEKQIAEFEERVEGHKKSERFAVEKDSPYSRIYQDIQKLERARTNLKNHMEAKVQVEALLREVEQQENRQKER